MGNICGTDVTRLPVNPNSLDLTHFELLKVVGKGGFGKVNAVQKLDTNQYFAMKRMEKAKVLAKESHLRMLWIERDIMSKLRSPFLCRLMYSFQSRTELFFVMPFMQGGDLRYHLDNRERSGMSEPDCAFYAAEMLLGLQELHSLMIVYRDMKPDNVLLDGDGHLRLSDFGISVQLTAEKHWMTRGRAGTPGYQSPELLANQWYGVSPDVWSFGVTVYELLHRKRPWKSLKINQEMTPDYFAHINYSERLSDETRDFITGLLTVDVKRRLGYKKIGWDWDRVKRHPFFRSIDWMALSHKHVKPPVKPDTERANCPGDHDLEEQFLNTAPAEIMEKDQKLFRGFSFNTKLDGTAGAPPNASLPDTAASATTKRHTPQSVKVNGSGHAAAVTGTGVMPGVNGSTGGYHHAGGAGMNEKYNGFDQKTRMSGVGANGTGMNGVGANYRASATGPSSGIVAPNDGGALTPPLVNGYAQPTSGGGGGGGGAGPDAFDPNSMIGSAGRRPRLMSDDSVDGAGMMHSGGITGNDPALGGGAHTTHLNGGGANGLPNGLMNGMSGPDVGGGGTGTSSPGSVQQHRLIGQPARGVGGLHVALPSNRPSVLSALDPSSNQNSARYLSSPTQHGGAQNGNNSAFTPKGGPTLPLLSGLPSALATGFGSPGVHSASGSGGGTAHGRGYHHTPSASTHHQPSLLVIGASASSAQANGVAGSGPGSTDSVKQLTPQQHQHLLSLQHHAQMNGTPVIGSPMAHTHNAVESPNRGGAGSGGAGSGGAGGGGSSGLRAGDRLNTASVDGRGEREHTNDSEQFSPQQQPLNHRKDSGGSQHTNAITGAAANGHIPSGGGSGGSTAQSNSSAIAAAGFATPPGFELFQAQAAPLAASLPPDSQNQSPPLPPASQPPLVPGMNESASLNPLTASVNASANANAER